MASDPRYGSAAWKQTRRAILRRDGYICQIRGPRCNGHATTVHHIVPSSVRPDLFFASSNLAAACGRCNYGEGAQIAADNQRQIYRIPQLEWTIRDLEEKLDAANRELEEYRARDRAPRPQPAIH